MAVKPKVVTLKIVSELGREILTEYRITLHDLRIPRFNELTENIWDLHPYLYYEENYEIYWCYSESVFLKVKDYFSYLTALELMHDCIFYVILRDTEPWIFVDEFTDSCVCPCSEKYILMQEYNRNKLLYMDFDEFYEQHNHIRDEDILIEALADIPKPRAITRDDVEYYRKVDHAKLGKKKTLAVLEPPDDDIINLGRKTENVRRSKTTTPVKQPVKNQNKKK